MYYILFIIQLYVIYTVVFYLFSFNRVKLFLNSTALVEIARFKEEFNIRNKFFDRLTIFIFLMTLPIYYGKDC